MGGVPRFTTKACAKPYATFKLDLKKGFCKDTMNINQSCHCDYDQGKQHTSDHLLPHALPDVHLTRSSVQV